MPSTPNSADSLGDLVSPSRMNLPSRKRSHSKHLDGAFAPVGDVKSRRTSPSPYMTGPTTPSSTMSSGYGYYPAFGDGYFDLTLFVNNFTILPLHYSSFMLRCSYVQTLTSFPVMRSLRLSVMDSSWSSRRQRKKDCDV